MTGSCQYVIPGDARPCRTTASWLVGVGTRKAGEQRSCKVHLSPTCEALRLAEGRPGVYLSVRRIYQGRSA